MNDPSSRKATPGRASAGLRWTITLVVCILVGAHFLMTAIYLGPPNLAKLAMQDVAEGYMRPLFKQNWHLFSPMPAFDSVKLPVRCQLRQDASWTEWADPLKELYEQHYRYRVTGHGKLVQFYRAVGADVREALVLAQTSCREELAQWELDEASRASRAAALAPGVQDVDRPPQPRCDETGLIARLRQQPAYELAESFSREVCAANLGSQAIAAQFKVMDFIPKKYTQRNEPGAMWGSVMEMPFPPVALSDFVTDGGLGHTMTADPLEMNP